MKILISLSLLLMALSGFSQSQRTDQPWQLDLAAGIQSYYAPVEDLKWSRSELVTSAGLNKLLGHAQKFSVGLQLQFARNHYQGSAVSMQLIGQYTPVLFNKIELGIGTGLGYRLAFYPSKPLRWNGEEWVKGKPTKGIVQVPVQLSVGYRSVKVSSYEIRPYFAYQLQALFGYSPDLSPLPVSNFSMGLKIHNYKK